MWRNTWNVKAVDKKVREQGSVPWRSLIIYNLQFEYPLPLLMQRWYGFECRWNVWYLNTNPNKLFKAVNQSYGENQSWKVSSKSSCRQTQTSYRNTVEFRHSSVASRQALYSEHNGFHCLLINHDLHIPTQTSVGVHDLIERKQGKRQPPFFWMTTMRNLPRKKLVYWEVVVHQTVRATFRWWFVNLGSRYASGLTRIGMAEQKTRNLINDGRHLCSLLSKHWRNVSVRLDIYLYIWRWNKLYFA